MRSRVDVISGDAIVLIAGLIVDCRRAAKEHVMSKSFFWGTDTQLCEGANLFSAKINQDPEAYGLSIEAAAEFAVLAANYDAAYRDAAQVETRNQVKTAAKRAAKIAVREAASSLAKIIDGTSITDEQKINLGLSVRKTPTRKPVPEAAPVVRVRSVIARTVEIRVCDSTVQGRRGKPKDVAFASVYSYVGEHPPEDPTMYKFEGVTTTTKMLLNFPMDVPSGATVWLTASWSNPSGKAGPSCPPVCFTLQGGPARAAG